jgi:hypothetical protein
MQGEFFAADLIRFPVDSRTLLVRRTARRLFELQDDKAATYEFWAETCLSVKAAEKTEEGGQAAMQAFTAAVCDEMRAIARHDQRRRA